MKKLLIIAITVFTVITSFAQTPNTTAPKYGGWLYVSEGKDSYDHFKGGDKFPPAVLKHPNQDYKYTLSPTMQKKVASVIQVFKDAYPKPYLESMYFSTQANKKIPDSNATSFSFDVTDYPFMYKSNGDLLPINLMSQLGSPKLAIRINTYPYRINTKNWAFAATNYAEMETYNEAIKDIDFYGFRKSLRIINPQVEAVQIGYGNKRTPVNADDVKNADDENKKRYFWNKFVIRDADIDHVDEVVIITHNNQLPLKPLTKIQFLELVMHGINFEKNEFLKAEENFIKLTPGLTDKDKTKSQKRVADKLAQYQASTALIERLKKENESTKNSTAIIHPDFRNLLSNVSMLLVYVDNELDKSPRARKNEVNFSNLFTANQAIGFTPAAYFDDYFKSASADDIKTITIAWSYKTRRPNNKDYQKIRPKSSSAVYSDEPNSFMEGMLKRVDWKKLEGLLAK